MLAERPGRDRKEEALLCFNGIDGRSGDYLLAPASARGLADVARGKAGGIGNIAGLGGMGGKGEWARLRELQAWVKRWGKVRRGLKEGLNPGKLEEAGWGVIFPQGADTVALRDALAPLLDHRRAQAAEHYREFVGDDGYRPEETKIDFLARHGAGPGPADPEKVPYYLLLVGDPEAIPFSFQYQLDVQYAVGRLCFASLAEYRSYAESVVAAESGQVERRRQASFFAPVNPGDSVTGMTSAYLAEPLAAKARREQPGWNVDTVLGGAATRDRLGRLLAGEETPAFLFAACHGLGFPAGDAQQETLQGALVCQDWPGPGGGIRREQYFAAEDVGEEARVHGLVAFCFACFGAGTPRWDAYAHDGRGEPGEPRPLSPRSFMGRLPQRLLGHPRGGALAVVGHVERAWGFSFAWTGAGAQTAVFESTVKRLLDGQPVGWAMEFFNQRYAELASDLAAEVEALGFGKKLDPAKLADLWTGSHDARNYTIVGDPAVRVVTGGPATL